MGVVNEVLSGIKEASEAIASIQKIAEAVKTGRDYVTKRHPEVKASTIALCEEIDKTARAIATASAIVTAFRFTVTGSDVDREPARFNGYAMANKIHVTELEQSITKLRGRCDVIRTHATAIGSKAVKGSGFWSLFGIDVAARDAELSIALTRLYNEEWAMYGLSRNLATAIQATMAAVAAALGPPGQNYAANVSRAATVLGEHAILFCPLELDCHRASVNFQDAIDALR